MISDQGEEHAAVRVLYVDDNEVNLRVVAALLEALNVAVTCCISANEALDILGQDEFDIIFTDIHMPEMSGFDVLREVRLRDGPNRAGPVIALTADLTRDDREYRELGFDGLLPKPVTLRALCDILLQFRPADRRASAA